jgi:hypothetical protein
LEKIFPTSENLDLHNEMYKYAAENLNKRTGVNNKIKKKLIKEISVEKLLKVK